MLQVKFKNLEKSELAREAVVERMEPLLSKFEGLRNSGLAVTLERENSPTQAGPDLFTAKVHIPRGPFKDITIAKANSNLYRALADLVDHMLETLNRALDKRRAKSRAKARQLASRT